MIASTTFAPGGSTWQSSNSVSVANMVLLILSTSFELTAIFVNGGERRYTSPRALLFSLNEKKLISFSILA
jgi:hypothetical protein